MTSLLKCLLDARVIVQTAWNMEPDLADTTLLEEINYLIGILIEKHSPPPTDSTTQPTKLTA